MIDVKIIKKPKNKASTPTLRTPGAAYGDHSVKEAVHASEADTAKMAEKASLAEQAEHAKKADEANHAQAANKANHARMADEVSLESKTLSRFLRNDIPNTAAEVVTFLKGIIAKAVSFFQGIVNKGDIKNYGDITNTGNIRNAGDITNSGNIMTKNLTVTGKATFFELEIQKAKAAGGMSVNSAGTFHIDAVVETADGFVCFQRAEKDGVTLRQTCEVNDQMMCSDGMNILKGGKGNHYYWRLVTDAPKEVVTRAIDGKEEKCLKLVLSKTDCSNPTDDKPKVGDELAQIGNRKNKERQSVIMTCAYNSFDGELKAPYWVQYGGVNDFELSTHKRTWFAANGSQVTGNFKVRSAGGGLEPIEDYMDRLVRENNSALYKLVENGTRPNLLWGSDLNLDGVDVTNKAAVEKHLGVALGLAKMDGGHFRYLKGEGVDGSDALMFKSDAGVEFAGLYWDKTEVEGSRCVRLKRNTKYTFSAWVKFENLTPGKWAVLNCEACEKGSDGDETCERRYGMDREPLSADMREWTRVAFKFTTGDSEYASITLYATAKGEAALYVCRPKLEEGDKATPWREYDKTADLERAILDIKSGEITLDARKTTVKGDLTAKSLRTTPATPGSPCVEIRDGEFSVMASGGRKGIEMTVDADGMPHLIFYDADGNPAYDLGHTGMRLLVDATVEERWLEERLMRDDGADAARVSHIGEADCQAFYTFRAAYNRKTGVKGSGAELDGVTFVEKSLSARRVPDGWYYPMNNGRLARVACLDAEIYATREYRYAGGKLAEWRDVRIARDSRGGFQFVGAGACQGGGGQGGGGKSQPLTP